MSQAQKVFIEGELVKDSNLIQSTCELDLLPTKQVLRWIIIDFVYYHLCMKGYTNIGLFAGESGQTAKNRLLDMIMRRLTERAEEMERKFKPRFENRNALLLSAPEKAQLDFMETLNNVWADGLANWGRFLGYITFTAAYCCSCMDTAMVCLVITLVDYAVDHLDSKMGKWILAHGGWRGFYQALVTLNLN